MHPSRSQLLRTTIVQAFARTQLDDSDRTVPGGGGGGTGFAAFTPAPPSSSTRLPGIGDVVGSLYELTGVLGEGMFGKVYVAQRLDVREHRVALKLLPRSLYAGRNVERELVMLATVGHPHVVQLKDHGTTPEYVWLTMPVYQGETLAERLERGPLSCKQAYDIFLPIARGLEALHEAGLRHQDVKPENIYLAVFGGRVHPILLDLGVAAEKDAAFVAGTALYGAPEQVAALAGLPAPFAFGEKMDTYGLAATLLYALVGPAHFPGETATDRGELVAAQEKRTEAPISAGALPDIAGAAREDLAAALRRWLAYDPADRPSMTRMCEQLEVLLEPERAEERAEALRRERQRATITRFRVAFGVLAILGAAAGVVAYQKRETLRVAGELSEARAAGAASFDKLETCAASHQMATKQAAACKAALSMEREEMKRSLEDIMRTGTAAQAEHAQEIHRYEGRIKACEDGAAAQKRACEDEATRTVTAGALARAELIGDRDAALRRADQEKSGRLIAEAERDACKADARALAEERDALKAAAAKAAAAKPAPPPGGSAAPSAGSAAPAVGPAPTVAPAPAVDPAPRPEPRGPTVPPEPQPAPPEPKVAPAPPAAADEPRGT